MNPLPVLERKMVIALPIWAGDKSVGFELLKLWADLEDSYNPNIAIAIIIRFDMNVAEIPPALVSYVQNKFKVFIHKTKRNEVGWPAGCNGLELGAYEWFIELNRGHTPFGYDYMLIAESDTVPLRKGWADEIRNEAYDNKAMILGSYLRRPDCYCEHINGNCVMHKDFWKQCRNFFLCPPRIGWDAYIGPTALAIGTPSRLIWQDYRLGAPDNPWKGDDYLWETKFYKSDKTPLYGKPVYPAMIHGCKGMLGINAVRKRLLK